MEAELSIHRTSRLGVCRTAQEGQTAVLARYTLALLRQARGTASRGEQAHLISHVPSYFRNAPQCQRRKCESGAGAPAPRQHEGHHRRLHASSQSAEARSAEQAGPDGPEKSGLSRLSGPYWTITPN